MSGFILKLTPSVGSFFFSWWYLMLAFERAGFGGEVRSVDDLNSSRIVQCVRLHTHPG